LFKSAATAQGFWGALHDPDIGLDPVNGARPLARRPGRCAKKKIISPEAQQVDALFAKWNSPASPGASVAVPRDGKIVYSHGYGMASLEYGAPNTPATRSSAVSR
jgi:CubicO group peptidase (beta-lactamase class C family)